MATGFILDAGIPINRPGDALSERIATEIYGDRGAVDSSFPLSGGFTTHQPVSMLFQTLSGTIQYSFFEDFYNRIHFYPPVVNFGNIATTTTLNFGVWNAFVKPQTLQSVTETNTEGLSLKNPAIPYTFGSLESKKYNITASDGPSVIDAIYDFDFGIFRFNLIVIGFRSNSILIPFQPNWENPFVVRHEYKTDIITVTSGREQRRANRQYPRIRTEFNILVADNRRREFSQILMTSQERDIIIPNYCQLARTTDEFPVNTKTASISPVSWLVTGIGVIIETDNHRQVLTVENITGNILTFRENSNITYPLGTRINPVFPSNFMEEQSTVLHTNQVTTAALSFDGIPGKIFRSPVPVATDFLNETEIFATKPNYAESVNIAMKSERDTIDFDHGRTRLFRKYDYPTRKTKMRFDGMDNRKSELLLDFFRRQKGRQGQFYVPSWESDFNPIRRGKNSLQVEGPNFATGFADSHIHRAIVLNLKNSTKIYREVSRIYISIDIFGKNSTIEVTENFEESLLIDDIKDVSWLYFSRFGSDSMTMKWLTNSVSTVNFNFFSLVKDTE